MVTPVGCSRTWPCRDLQVRTESNSREKISPGSGGAERGRSDHRDPGGGAGGITQEGGGGDPGPAGASLPLLFSETTHSLLHSHPLNYLLFRSGLFRDVA